MKTPAQRIAENVQRVHDQIATATKKSGRRASDVTLIAVTKYVDAKTTQLVMDAGCCHLGESRPQQLWEKAATCSDDRPNDAVRWHLIGHLQRNKVARTLDIASLLHSVDSPRLLREIDKSAAVTQSVADVLLEVNISGDASKHGWAPKEMPAILESIQDLSHIRIRGLMAMSGIRTDTESARREFAAVETLRQSLATDCPENCQMRELSMGMSRDFCEAIEEGATMVRVGSALFKGVA